MSLLLLFSCTIYAEDNNNNWNTLADSITVQDTTAPSWANLIESADPLTLGQNETITIDVTDFSGISQVLLEYEGSNHTMTNIGGDTWSHGDWQPSLVGQYPYTISQVINIR